MADDTTTDDIETDEVTTEETAEAKPDLGDSGKKALDAERSRARAAERELKALKRQFDELQQASMSDQEKAVAEARNAGKAEASIEAGKRLARAELRAQGASKGFDVTAMLEDVDLSRFVGEDGEPDEKAIAKAVDRWAGSRARDIGQGYRQQAPVNDMNVMIRRLAGHQ